jgi:hypothetical protein
MLATCQQHVGNIPKCCKYWVDMRVGADTKITLTQEFCVGDHQKIVDTVVPTDTVLHTPTGGNTVGKLNQSKLSQHVNVLRLVLPLVHWWYCCCCFFLWQWTMVSSTTVVAVTAVAAWPQRQWHWGRWWTTIGSESGQQQEHQRSHDSVQR